MKSRWMRFRIRTALAVTLLVALFFAFVIAPEIRRANNFANLKAQGVVLYAPPIVMFGGQPFNGDLIPQPYWLKVRQRIASTLGVRTVPWIPEGSLEIPEDPSAQLLAIINSHKDFQELANRRSTLRGWGGDDIPIFDIDCIVLPESSTSIDPNVNIP